MDHPGIRAEGDLLYSMRGEVARLLGRENTNFPGAQPVSFARRHLEELRRDEYVLSTVSLCFGAEEVGCRVMRYTTTIPIG